MKLFKGFLILTIAGFLGVAMAADPANKLKVLVVTGGHGFEKEPFEKMFRDNPEIAVTFEAHSKTNATGYERADFATYDVVVLYDLMRTITEAQKAKLTSLFDRGQGLVVLHHAICAYADWPEYEQIIGGRYTEPNPMKPGTVTKAVGWKHDEEIPVVIVATNHPVTAGVTDFVIHDEIYWGFRVSKDVTTLLTTTHPKSGKPIGWCRTQGKSRVVYLQLGHGHEAFGNENYRKLVAQSIRWTANKER